MKLTKHNAKLKAGAIKRAKKVAAMRAKGRTWAQIGAAFSISRQRAQQIASRASE